MDTGVKIIFAICIIFFVLCIGAIVITEKDNNIIQEKEITVKGKKIKRIENSTNTILTTILPQNGTIQTYIMPTGSSTLYQFRIYDGEEMFLALDTMAQIGKKYKVTLRGSGKSFFTNYRKIIAIKEIQ